MIVLITITTGKMVGGEMIYREAVWNERRWAKMTERQRELIEGMNGFCTEKCVLDADVQDVNNEK